jgi:hypothetical protein
MDHAERLEYLDALLGGTDLRHRRLTIFFDVPIAASLSIPPEICRRTSVAGLIRALLHAKTLSPRLGQR